MAGLELKLEDKVAIVAIVTMDDGENRLNLKMCDACLPYWIQLCRILPLLHRW